MSTIIKFRREGTVHKPFWRIVVTDSRKPKGCVEQLGTYDAMHKPAKVVLDEEKTLKWLRQGAAPSPSVSRIFKQKGLIQKAAKAAGTLA